MPVSAYDRVVMHMVENSAVMSGGATVITTRTGEDLQVPKSTAYVTSALTNEGASITESDPTLGVSTLKAYKFASFFQISRELANDSQSDLLGFLERQAGESLALAFGPYLITGTGTAQPQGIVTAAGTGKTGPTGTQATAGQGTDCLYDLIGSVAEPYVRQASTGFIMTNASLMIARKLKDSAGQPVAAASGAPGGNTLLGFPAFVDPNVAAMAANAKSIIFGDLSRYFVRVSTASASRGRTNTPSSPIWSASAPSSGSTVRSSTRTA
jgi:HK97 family phage major capsid protein